MLQPLFAPLTDADPLNTLAWTLLGVVTLYWLARGIVWLYNVTVRQKLPFAVRTTWCHARCSNCHTHLGVKKTADYCPCCGYAALVKYPFGAPVTGEVNPDYTDSEEE